MTDPRTAETLAGIIRRESRSLLQYVRDAYPWTTAEERTALGRIDGMIAEETAGIGSLQRLLQRRRVTPPYVGSYPMAFTEMNYISLDHLLPRLVGYERQAAADLERDLAGLSDPEAAEAVRGILEGKRRHLQALEELAAGRGVAAVR